MHRLQEAESRSDELSQVQSVFLLSLAILSFKIYHWFCTIFLNRL